MDTADRPNLLDLDLADCEALAVALGSKAFHGRNLFKWIHKHGVLDLDAMTDIPKGLRAALVDVGFHRGGFPVEVLLADQVARQQRRGPVRVPGDDRPLAPQLVGGSADHPRRP